MAPRYPYPYPSRVLHNSCCYVNETETNRLHPLVSPRLPQNQPLHKGIEIIRKNHDSPPGRVLPEIARRKSASRKITLHCRMRFLTLAASLIKPWDKFLPSPVHIRYDPEHLVPLTLQPHDRKKILFIALLHSRQLRLLHLLPGCEVPICRPILTMPYL